MKNWIQYICSKDKRTKVVLVLLVCITALGAFLRLYHFSGWLHFELDQARDVFFVSEAVTGGPGELPLLGPKASGTALRVGPAFYYMEYISALLFGNTPQGHAFFVPLLSIFSIPLLYFLMRRMFPVSISLGMTYLYSVSAFFVLYQRFAWNPNVLPFFLIAGLLTFFVAIGGKSHYPGRWLVLASFCFVISTQLHFVAFFAIPFFVIGTLIVKRPRFSLKVWGISLVVIPFVLYLPFFVNEWAFHGENTKAFFEALDEKKEKVGLPERVATNILTQSKAYALILSGNEKIVLPSLEFEGITPKVKCGDYCKKTPDWIQVVSIAFFFLGIGLLLQQAFQRKGEVLFMGIWFFAIFLTFTGVASQLAPRFYLLLVPLPYVLLGLIFLVLYKRLRKFFWGAFAIVILVCSYTNLSLLAERFEQMRNVSLRNVSISTDRILEEPIRATYEQQEMIAKYLAEEHQKNGYPVFIDAEPFWRRSIKYIAERKYGVSIGFLFSGDAYAKSNNYVILRTKKEGGSVFEKRRGRYEIGEKREFGTLSVYTLRVKHDRFFKGTPEIQPVLETDGGDIGRITWRDAWGAIKN